jgi:hypothetical protein
MPTNFASAGRLAKQIAMFFLLAFITRDSLAETDLEDSAEHSASQLKKALHLHDV